jgi:hypothetical protein
VNAEHAVSLRHLGRALATAAAILLPAGCDSTADTPTGSTPAATVEPASAHAHATGEALTATQLQGVARVRRATTALHDIAAAHDAGYTVQYPAGCAHSPSGAQGFHYLNPELVDATVELLKPELVMYEPQPDGSLQLIGVDYVVPFDAWTQPEPPTLLGMPFMRNEPLGVWALHIWAWRPNPSGMFAMWNPKASCALAQ